MVALGTGANENVKARTAEPARINVREKTWRDWFIKGITSSEAADRAGADYEGSRPRVDRKGRWKRCGCASLPRSKGRHFAVSLLRWHRIWDLQRVTTSRQNEHSVL
jgi:hypothetical protein